MEISLQMVARFFLKKNKNSRHSSRPIHDFETLEFPKKVENLDANQWHQLTKVQSPITANWNCLRFVIWKTPTFDIKLQKSFLKRWNLFTCWFFTSFLRHLWMDFSLLFSVEKLKRVFVVVWKNLDERISWPGFVRSVLQKRSPYSGWTKWSWGSVSRCRGSHTIFEGSFRTVAGGKNWAWAEQLILGHYFKNATQIKYVFS